MKCFAAVLCLLSALSSSSVLGQTSSLGFPSDVVSGFATAALETVAAEPGNKVFSPTSIVTGLGMLYSGLGGRTRQTVARDLGFPRSDTQFDRGFMQFKTSKSKSLKQENIVVVLQAAKVHKEYGKTMKSVFGAQPFQHGFRKNPTVAVDTINRLVSEATEGKIDDLMPEGSVTADTKVVLVNAVHFKSDWQEPFEETQKQEFTAASGRTRQVDTMIGQRSLGHMTTEDGTQIFEVPLADADYAFVIAMPPKGNSMRDAVSDLPSLMPNILNSKDIPTKPVQLYLPKFKVESRLRLRDLLVSEYPSLLPVFTRGGGANFTRMARFSQGFYVDEVHHKSVIEVAEQGVEAAGATGIAVTLYSFFEPEFELRVDRPFLYFIVDAKRKNVLFAGVVKDPTL